jgi:Alpha amylase, catalytic domain
MRLKSINDLDLSPKPGKTYWKNGAREWREEFIYFLMVDRFHDNNSRMPVESIGKTKGFGTEKELKASCGGTLKGIKNNLTYIKDLGCTALWLSPVFENNTQSYHGYAIHDYTLVDSRFGTNEDLAELVDSAHALDMRAWILFYIIQVTTGHIRMITHTTTTTESFFRSEIGGLKINRCRRNSETLTYTGAKGR